MWTAIVSENTCNGRDRGSPSFQQSCFVRRLPSLSFLVAKYQVQRKCCSSSSHQPLEPTSRGRQSAVSKDTSVGVFAADSQPPSASQDPTEFCVLDTGCQRSAVGSQTLALIIKALPAGMQVQYERQSFQFRGVGGNTHTSHVAKIPICLGKRPSVIRAAVLEEPSDAPLLISLPILQALGSIIDMNQRQLHLRNIDEVVDIRHNSRGQMCLRLFDFGRVKQNLTEEPWSPKRLIGDECVVYFQQDRRESIDRREPMEDHMSCSGDRESHTHIVPVYEDTHMCTTEATPHREADSSQPVISNRSSSKIVADLPSRTVHFQHGDRGISQAHVHQPCGRGDQQVCASMEANVHSHEHAGNVDADVCCDVQPVHPIHPPMEQTPAQISAQCRHGIPRRAVRDDGNGHHREEASSRTGGEDEEEGTARTPRDAEGSTPGGSEEHDFQPELCGDSQRREAH